MKESFNLSLSKPFGDVADSRIRGVQGTKIGDAKLGRLQKILSEEGDQ